MAVSADSGAPAAVAALPDRKCRLYFSGYESFSETDDKIKSLNDNYSI